MNEVLSFVLGIIIGGGAAWYLLKSGHAGKIPKLIQRQRDQRDENRRKIFKFLEDSDRISNKDVEKMLGVSDATATRYLDEFEKEGSLRQVGQDGRGVFYSKVK